MGCGVSPPAIINYSLLIINSKSVRAGVCGQLESGGAGYCSKEHFAIIVNSRRLAMRKTAVLLMREQAVLARDRLQRFDNARVDVDGVFYRVGRHAEHDSQDGRYKRYD